MLESTPAASWRKISTAVCMFAVGFVAVAAVVHASIGDPFRLYADVRSEKLTILDEWAGRASSAAFGSSHVHNAFDPRAFDLGLQGTPLQTRSINLAIAGGSQSEQRATALEFVRHLQPPARSGAATETRACMVILELSAGANFTPDHLVHPRAINVYDLPTARFEMRLTDAKMSIRQRVGRVGFALVATALHYLNVGMLSNVIFTPPLDAEALGIETQADQRGALLMKQVPHNTALLQEILAARPGQSVATEGGFLPGNRDLLEELQASSKVSHLQMVYIVMPMLHDLTSYSLYPDSLPYTGGTAAVINLGRPDLHPELYDLKYWYDDSHVDAAGAKMLSGLLANDLKAWVAAHGAPPKCGS